MQAVLMFCKMQQLHCFLCLPKTEQCRLKATLITNILFILMMWMHYKKKKLCLVAELLGKGAKYSILL